ncbi:MAG: hypothetical protein AMXMBFR84_47630 [Candidatus Hydrogenedentota bacterium]
MEFMSDLRTAFHLAFAPKRGASHAERLERFYARQAADYDRFRERLLHGRKEMFAALQMPDNGTWIDMGGGTGASLEFAGNRIATLMSATVVDLSPSLLNLARKRIAVRGWKNCDAIEGDVTTYRPASNVDAVTFSYSLTMIPDWFKAIDHAFEVLGPGGLIGVVDFYVSRKHPLDDWKKHGWFTRSFWPVWFATDNVYLSPDHVPYLHDRFTPVHFTEGMGTVPLLAGMKVPYYIFIGRKRG